MTGLRHLLRTWKVAWAGLFALAVTFSASDGGASDRQRVPQLDPGTPPVPASIPSDLVIEVDVSRRDGRPPRAIRPSDFEVTVDGRRREVLSIARLYRGPGAELIARRAPAAIAGEARPLSEPSRVVVIAIDRASLLPGEEQAAREVAESCMDVLGLSDRIGVLALPIDARTLTISFERAAAREALSRLQAAPLVPARKMAVNPPPRQEGAARNAEDQGTTEGRDVEPGDPTLPRLPRAALSATPGPGAGEAIEGGESARATARWTLETLRQVLVSMESLPHGKTILFLSGGLVASNAETELRATVEAAARAHTRIVSLHLPTRSPLRDDGAASMRRLAEETGGWLFALPRRPQQALAQVAERLSLSYLLLLAAAPEDAEPSPHAVRVQAPRRNDLSLCAPAFVARGRLNHDELAAALSPAPAQSTGPAETEPSTQRTAPKARGAPVFHHDHDVDLVLARASQYVEDYGPVLSSIVSEERYEQDVRMELAVSSLRKQRTIRSDFLTVRIEGSDGWVPFRDVFEVDGKPVRDRQDRLTRLFLDRPSAERLRERRDAIMKESARYNIGTVSRTLNVPTLPLLFLERGSTPRFAFRKAGEESLDGRRLWVLEYSETASPTFIRTNSGKDLQAWGRVWVDPVNGTVLETELHVSVAVVTTRYGRWPGFVDVWLPLEMKERYVTGGEIITGTATYSNFRQFQVSTQQDMRLPK